MFPNRFEWGGGTTITSLVHYMLNGQEKKGRETESHHCTAERERDHCFYSPV